MHHSTRGTRYSSPIVVFLLSVVITACGGGGGGGGGDGPQPVTYSGVTTQAEITSTNADTLAAGAIVAGDVAGTTLVVGAADTQTAPPSTRTVAAVKALRKSLTRLNYRQGSVAAGALVSDSDTVFGACGGSLSYSITVDDVTGDFSGSITFKNFCEDGDRLSGGIGFSGNINPSTLSTFDPQFTWISLNIPIISVSVGSDSFALSGSISVSGISYAGSTLASETVSLTVNVRDGASRICRIENLQFTVTYNSPSLGTDRVVIASGRFYWHPHGYVDVVSTTDLLMRDTDDYPYAGVLVITGRTNSKARLTALNTVPLTYTIEVDANGDDTYEFSATRNWADL